MFTMVRIATYEQMHHQWSTCEWLLRKPTLIVQLNSCNSLHCHAHNLSILRPSINAQGHICRKVVNFTVKVMFLHFSSILHNDATSKWFAFPTAAKRAEIAKSCRKSTSHHYQVHCLFHIFEWPKFRSFYHSPCSHYLRGFKHLCHLKSSVHRESD